MGKLVKKVRRTLVDPLRWCHKLGQQWWTQERNLRISGKAYYNYWQVSSAEDVWLLQFLRRPGLIELAQRARVSVFSVFGPRLMTKVSRSDLNIFYTAENLVNYPDYADYLLNDVDLALGFERLEHPKYMRLPYWLLTTFSPFATLEEIKGRLAQIDPPPGKIEKRRRAAVLVAQHDTNGIRQSICDLFSRHAPVVYGGSYPSGHTSLAPGQEAKLELISKFQFNICPENSDSPGYTTEKLFEALWAGCIPIYWGGGGVAEPDIIQQTSVLWYLPSELQLLDSQLGNLLNNPDALSAFYQRPRFQPDAAERIHGYYTELEQRLASLLS